MALNIPNIKRVRDHIAGLPPEQFDMSWWAGNPTVQANIQPADLLHNCGTCGCIGGWTEALLFPRLGADWPERGDYEIGGALGLSDAQSDELFYPSGIGNWKSISIQKAVAVLDHLMATGNVDWSVAEGVS